jgi:hypothetical protein
MTLTITPVRSARPAGRPTWLECPHCHAAGFVPAAAWGKLLECRRCGAWLMLADDELGDAAEDPRVKHGVADALAGKRPRS